MDAGYAHGSAKVTASKLLKKPTIQAALANQRATFANPLVNPEHVEAAAIADATERRSVLSKILREGEHRDRIRAADVLNRMDALYVERKEVTHLKRLDLTKLSDAELAQLEQMAAKAAVGEAVH